MAVQLVKSDWREHAKLITAAWQKGVESIVETGRALIDAKRDLDHGAFEAMVQMELPFCPRTAQRLMKIAEHPVISKATHASLLPSSWMTLYELSKVPQSKLIGYIKDHTINPKMLRKDAVALLPPPKSKPSKPAEDDDEDEGDSDETCWRRGLLYRATNAIGEAAFDDWSQYRIDAELVTVARRAAAAWNKVATYLEGLSNEQTQESKS